MTSDDTLRHLIDERKLNRDALNEKIRRLRADLAIEAGRAANYQLEEQIKQAEKDRNDLEQEIQKFDVQRVYTALMFMDYKPQMISFRQYTTSQRVGAFLIHGIQEFGHLWALAQLLASIPRSTITPLIHLDLLSSSLRKDVNALWRELGRHLGMPLFNTPREDILQRVAQRLQTQHLILIIRNVNEITGAQLQQIVEQFWTPLANTAQDALQANRESMLLMFLVDYDDQVCKWSIQLNDPSNIAQPQVPVRLPELATFADTVIISWIDNWTNLVPVEAALKPQETAQQILRQSSNGIPEEVADQICQLFDPPYHYDGEQVWINL